MRATVHIGGHDHQQLYGAAMKAGLERHGIAVTVSGYDDPRTCDFAVVWGWKQIAVIKAAPHVLVMERGHVGDRMALASCGWDGLARRGRYPRVNDQGARWRARYEHLMQPWAYGFHDGYALIVGQVPGDAALGGLDVIGWAEDIAELLAECGWRERGIRFRPHPYGGRGPVPKGTTRTRGTLAEDLRGASLCVTFNSTTGVEAVLAGVPTVTEDLGAMAWPVAAHDVREGAMCPNREAWAAELAWTQWTPEEIAAGEAWAHLAPIMEAA